MILNLIFDNQEGDDFNSNMQNGKNYNWYTVAKVEVSVGCHQFAVGVSD